MAEKLTIGKLAEKAGVNLQTIRYYESLGLLPEPNRTESNYRDYDISYLEHILFIKNSQELGFKLEEIKELVDLKFNKKAIGLDVKKIIKRKILELDTEISKLSLIKEDLEKLDQSCNGKMKTSCCPIMEKISRK
ncbi:MAG: MerR family DNA-binding transcriptional regulator [Candidatus Caenarcaniphilales bacterium]|nr:MerR family DNA-binding transcriptional regulator [Candidatus Caenarcaniphilales bacterium]